MRDEGMICSSEILGIARKLAQEYVRIYYVNILTEEYKEYDPMSAEGPAFIMSPIREDFFLSRTNGIFDTLYEEDWETFEEHFRKEELLSEICRHGEFSLVYRVKKDGGPVFMNMKGMQLEGDPDHIIVTVKNIDLQVRRERKYMQYLTRALNEANLDVLTGVKNRNAFIEYEKELERQIEERKISEFAIVVFDINGLKEINDSLGHQAGDTYIKAASEIICSIFLWSPVFRIGGDEFVAIASGEDYRYMERLIEQIEKINEENLSRGGIVIAAGTAYFRGNEKVSDVFERADQIMYQNKKRLKR